MEKTNFKSSIAAKILHWYDANARDLPWRVGPSAKAQLRPDPYRVWLSEIMLQQTTVATVTKRYEVFLVRWPTIYDLADASLDDVLGEWAGLGYYARARNLHKCARAVVETYNGVFPDTEEVLRTLPGIGDYTAAAIAAIAFDRHAIVIDGNIERVFARLFAIETPLPKAKVEIKKLAAYAWPNSRSGDFAQGLMDLGAEICRPKNPNCVSCPISEICAAHKERRADVYPLKAPKKAKPVRRGAAFALLNAKGEMLFERRPDNGLLGGMLGLPGTEWSEKKNGDVFASAPSQTVWQKAGEAAHTFTHFHLALDVYSAAAPKGFRRGARQQWIDPAAARLPTAMKKAVALAIENGKT